MIIITENASKINIKSDKNFKYEKKNINFKIHWQIEKIIEAFKIFINNSEKIYLIISIRDISYHYSFS